MAVALATGQTVAGIAHALGGAESTVKTHVKRVYRKLGIRKQTQLVRRILSLEGLGGPFANPQGVPQRGIPDRLFPHILDSTDPTRRGGEEWRFTTRATLQSSLAFVLALVLVGEGLTSLPLSAQSIGDRIRVTAPA